MIKWKKIGFAIATVTLLLASTACGNSNTPSNQVAPTNGGDNNNGKTKIVIATGGEPKPFVFVNDKNELDGYDIQVVKAIFKDLSQYDVTIEKTEFPSIFAGLDADRYRIGANNFASNKERKEKYIFSEPIFKNQFVIAVATNREDIKSFADLEGKTTEVSPSVNYTVALENYNKTSAKKPVNLKYSEADMAVVLQNVESGATDFNLIDAAMLQLYINEYGLKLKEIPLSKEDSERIGVPYSYLILSKGKNSEQLTKDVNQRIKQLLKDGTIAEISKTYLHGDFTPEVQ